MEKEFELLLFEPERLRVSPNIKAKMAKISNEKILSNLMIVEEYRDWPKD